MVVYVNPGGDHDPMGGGGLLQKILKFTPGTPLPEGGGIAPGADDKG